MIKLAQNYLFVQISCDMKWQKDPLPININSQQGISDVMMIENNGQLQEQTLQLVDQFLIKYDNNSVCKWMDIENCYLKVISHQEIGAGIKIHTFQQSFEFHGNIVKWHQILKKYTIQQNFEQSLKLIRRIAVLDGEEFFLARNKFDGREFSVKIIDKQHLMETGKEINILLKELSLQRKLSCEMIIKLEECYEGEKQIYLIFEQFSGQLLSEYKAKIQSEEQVIKIVHKMVKILNYLHNRDLIVNNLTMNCFVLKQKDNIDSLSFIVTKNCQLIYTADLQRLQYHQQQPIDYRKDTKQLGQIMIELCNLDQNQIFSLEEQEKALEKTTQNLSADGKQFLKQLLDDKPNKRYSTSDALVDVWFLKGLTIKQNKFAERLKKSHAKLQPLQHINHSGESEKSSSPLSPFCTSREGSSPATPNSSYSLQVGSQNPKKRNISSTKTLEPIRAGSLDKKIFQRGVKESTFKPSKQIQHI